MIVLVLVALLVALAAAPAQAQEAPICLSATVKLADKPETWEGKQTRDSVTGLRGGDKLYAQGGNDFVNGGRDNDEVDGGDGNDTLCGGRGDDTIHGGAGDDLIYGEEEQISWTPGLAMTVFWALRFLTTSTAAKERT
jgi:hypothetical protein